MSMHSNPLYPAHDFPRNWSAPDLADAVPLRLSERITLGLVEFAPTQEAANKPSAATGRREWRRHGYARCTELTAFRIR